MRTRVSILTLLAAFALALASIGSAAAATATTFGPTQFTRAAGPPQTFDQVFPRCGGGNCQLVVVNGDPNGDNRVTSAVVSLNGKQLFGPSDFQQQTARLVVPVSLVDSDRIAVMLRSAPGSHITVSIECDSFASVAIAASAKVNSSIWDNGILSLSIPLDNTGNAPATNVAITRLTANGGIYTGPTPVTYSAGTIGAGESQQIYAQFSNVNGSAAFPLTINGTYSFGAATCPFQAQATVNPPAAGNGGTPKFQTTVPRQNAATATYPRAPGHAEQQPNAENEYMPPLGRPRNLFTAVPAARSLERSRAFAPKDDGPSSGGGSAVSFVRNVTAGNYSNLPPDPSAAGSTPSGFVLTSANNRNGAADGGVAWSKDFGKTFTAVNLTAASGFTDPARPARTDFFPQNDGGLCCDQVIHYIPGKNLIVWLLQYWSPPLTVGGLPQAGTNRLRIAFATPQAAAADFLGAWSWFDITPATLGDNVATDWMDYPDLAYSNGSLYISVDHGVWNPAINPKTKQPFGQQVQLDRRWMIRTSLDDMANGAGSINLSYYEPIKNGLVKSHFVQSSPDTMYYAAQPDTSTLSVFKDPDSSSTVPTPVDISVTQHCTPKATIACDYTVPAPDGLDWNVAPHGVLGGAYVAPSVFCPPGGCTNGTRFLYFAYDGARDASVGRPFPYVRVEKIDADALRLVSELDIFNPGFAFSTPALVTRPGSTKDEVAISLATGGGGSYADNAVGFLGDFVAYVTTSSNATQSDRSSNVRYGDYFSVRNATGPSTTYGQGTGYGTLGYGVSQVTAGQTCAIGGCNISLQWILFGRNEDLFPTAPPPPIR